MGPLDSLAPKECVGVRLVSNHPAITHWRHKIPANLRDKAFRYTLWARYSTGSEKASGSLMTGRILFILVLGQPGLVNLPARDRKSTRLNSSHANISYAV